MREMKDSGIEWVGQIPKNWKVMANKYVMHKTKDIIPTYCGEDILSLTINGVIVRDLDAGGKMPASFDGYQRLKPGNLLMCLFDYDVTPRCIGLIKDNGITSPAYSQFIVDKGNHTEYYYYYYLMIDHSKALLHMAKNLRHSFTEEQLGMIYTPVPPIEEQQRIASFLDSKCAEIDALTADIQKEIETLQEYRKSVITEAVTKGLDPNVEMKDSGIEWIGDIPRHWTTIKLKNTHDGMNVGESIDKEYWEESDGDIVFYTAGLNPITTTYRHFPPEKYTRDNDLLLARNGTPYVYLPIENSVYTDHIIRVKIKDGYSKKYIMYCLERSINAEIVDTVSIATWSSSIWNRQCFPLPSYEEQKVIASFLDSKCSEIDSIIADKQKQLETLAEYRKSLIYEYVTGKKEVPKA